MTDTFPRQLARTRHFTLGRPRSFTVAPDGARVLFLRSRGAEDPVTDLWSIELATGDERRLVDAVALLEGEDEELPPEERARRERARETSTGVVAYACDRAVDRAVFTLAGRLFTVEVTTGEVSEQSRLGAVFDPRLAPDGERIAYVTGDALVVAEVGGDGRVVASEDDDGVAWGRAEFAAAEEMERDRGFWWSPDGSTIAATRVDERMVARWHVADPSRPGAEPTVLRYPPAGGDNADVSLHLVDPAGVRDPVAVDLDRGRHPYLARVHWGDHGLVVLVLSRDQRTWAVLGVDPSDGSHTELRRDHDDQWLDLPVGAPVLTRDGGVALVVADREADAHRLVVGDRVATSPELQVRGIVDVDDDRVVFTASHDDPTQVHVWRWDPRHGVERLTTRDGVHAAVATGDVVVVVGQGLDGPPRAEVRTPRRPPRAVASELATPLVEPRPRRLALGARELEAALLLPTDDPGGPLPVVLDPYGGPHAQRVLSTRYAYLTSQWLADQGYAVLVVDGRGTPGRGPGWERAVHGDLAAPVLEDQVAALEAAVEEEPRLDLDRVAIRGWSFGGFLAALAVLRRPDVFRAGIAGAPVTDWSLYDTVYTERYLGTPGEDPDAYRRSSLVDGDARLVDALEPGPGGGHLLIIHGLADDNVVAAHSLRLSHALLAAGRPHRFLPLSGVTHMTPQEVVAENLLLLQRAFLRETIGAADVASD